MKITTAIELLRHNSEQRKLQEMKDLKALIILATNNYMTEKDFTIGFLDDTDLVVNLDEISVDIDGLFIADWLRANCHTKFESDKSINVTGLR
jgi:uncharacterized lipoprotein YajG